MLVSSRAQPRGTPGLRPDFHRVDAQARSALGELPALRTLGEPTGALNICIDWGPDSAARVPVWHGRRVRGESTVRPSDRLTWAPPWGVVSGLSGIAVAGFRPAIQRNQDVISPTQCNGC